MFWFTKLILTVFRYIAMVLLAAFVALSLFIVPTIQHLGNKDNLENIVMNSQIQNIFNEKVAETINDSNSTLADEKITAEQIEETNLSNIIFKNLYSWISGESSEFVIIDTEDEETLEALSEISGVSTELLPDNKVTLEDIIPESEALNSKNTIPRAYEIALNIDKYILYATGVLIFIVAILTKELTDVFKNLSISFIIGSLLSVLLIIQPDFLPPILDYISTDLFNFYSSITNSKFLSTISDSIISLLLDDIQKYTYITLGVSVVIFLATILEIKNETVIIEDKEELIEEAGSK